MAWFTVSVSMRVEYSIEADTVEEAERLVQRELPDDAAVYGMDTELED
jgi:hypothetical protein